jgi:hypothetical protein
VVIAVNSSWEESDGSSRAYSRTVASIALRIRRQSLLLMSLLVASLLTSAMPQLMLEPMAVGTIRPSKATATPVGYGLTGLKERSGRSTTAPVRPGSSDRRAMVALSSGDSVISSGNNACTLIAPPLSSGVLALRGEGTPSPGKGGNLLQKMPFAASRTAS